MNTYCLTLFSIIVGPWLYRWRWINKCSLPYLQCTIEQNSRAAARLLNAFLLLIYSNSVHSRKELFSKMEGSDKWFYKSSFEKFMHWNYVNQPLRKYVYIACSVMLESFFLQEVYLNRLEPRFRIERQIKIIVHTKYFACVAFLSSSSCSFGENRRFGKYVDYKRLEVNKSSSKTTNVK